MCETTLRKYTSLVTDLLKFECFYILLLFVAFAICIYHPMNATVFFIDFHWILQFDKHKHWALMLFIIKSIILMILTAMLFKSCSIYNLIEFVEDFNLHLKCFYNIYFIVILCFLLPFVFKPHSQNVSFISMSRRTKLKLIFERFCYQKHSLFNKTHELTIII